MGTAVGSDGRRNSEDIANHLTIHEVRVCALYVRMMFPPIYIQHEPVFVSMPPRKTRSQTTRQRYTLQVQQDDQAMQCQPQ